MKIKSLINLARPTHWVKNAVVIMPILFGLKFYDLQAWQDVLLAALMFCFASSLIYIFNDIKDRHTDKLHPAKKNRPLPSGQCSLAQAVGEMVILLMLILAVSFFVPRMVVVVTGIYILLQLAYSFILKKLVLVDVICISLGFVLRAVCGAVAIRVEISPWLFICMFTIFLFMGFCKRFNEQVIIGDIETASSHRRTLISYTPELLTHLITTSAGIAIVSFLSYSLSESTVERFGNDYFVYTLPIIVYAIFRFAMLSMKGVYSGPTEILIKDRAFEFAAAIWMVSAAVIILYGSQIKNFLTTLQHGS